MREHNERNGDRFLSRVMKYWPLLVALMSCIAMATTIKNKVDNHESRLTRLEDSMDSIRNNTDRLVDELLDKK